MKKSKSFENIKPSALGELTAAQISGKGLFGACMDGVAQRDRLLVSLYIDESVQSDSLCDGQVRGDTDAPLKILLSGCTSPLWDEKYAPEGFGILLDNAVTAGCAEYEKLFVQTLERCDGAVFFSDGTKKNEHFITTRAMQYAWGQKKPFFVFAKDKGSAERIKEKFSSAPVVTDMKEISFDGIANRAAQSDDSIFALFDGVYGALAMGKTEQAIDGCKKLSGAASGKSELCQMRQAMAKWLEGEAEISACCYEKGMACREEAKKLYPKLFAINKEKFISDDVKQLKSAMRKYDSSGNFLCAAICARRLRDAVMLDSFSQAKDYSHKACEYEEKFLSQYKSSQAADMLASDSLITGLMGDDKGNFGKANELWKNAGDGFELLGSLAAKLSGGVSKRQSASVKKEIKKREFIKWVNNLGKLRIPLLLLTIIVGLCALAGVTCGVKEVAEQVIIMTRATPSRTEPQEYTVTGEWLKYNSFKATVNAKNLQHEWDFVVESTAGLTITWEDGSASNIPSGKRRVRNMMYEQSFDIEAKGSFTITFKDGTVFTTDDYERPPKPKTTKKPTKRTTTTSTTTTATVSEKSYKLTDAKVLYKGTSTGVSVGTVSLEGTAGSIVPVSVSGVPVYDENGTASGETTTLSFGIRLEPGSVSASSGEYTLTGKLEEMTD